MPRLTRLRLLLLLLALAAPLLSHEPSAAASLSLSFAGDVTESGAANPFPWQDQDSASGSVGPVSATIGETSSSPHTSYETLGTGTADYGLVQMQTRMVLEPNGGGLGAIGTIQGFLLASDSITITPSDPSLVGTVGLWSFGLNITGTLDATGPLATDRLFSQWGLTLSTRWQNEFGDVLRDSTGFVQQNDGGVVTGDGFGLQAVSLQVPLGVPFSILWDGFLQVQASHGGATAGQRVADANLGNTIQFFGTDSVEDALGDPISFSMSSGSGTDWTSVVVPEPSTGLLLALGLGGLAWRNRMKHQPTIPTTRLPGFGRAVSLPGAGATRPLPIHNS